MANLKSLVGSDAPPAAFPTTPVAGAKLPPLPMGSSPSNPPPPPGTGPLPKPGPIPASWQDTSRIIRTVLDLVDQSPADAIAVWEFAKAKLAAINAAKN